MHPVIKLPQASRLIHLSRERLKRVQYEPQNNSTTLFSKLRPHSVKVLRIVRLFPIVQRFLMGNNPDILDLPECLVELGLEGLIQNTQTTPHVTSSPLPGLVDPRLQSIEHLLVGVNLPVVDVRERIGGVRADEHVITEPILRDTLLDDLGELI